MEHSISLSTTHGFDSKLMRRVRLSDALKFVIQNPYSGKHDCWLMSNGYKDTNGLYTREEFNFQWIDTVMLDVDNDDENPNQNLLDEFKKDYSEYVYFLWESASSTSACPKARVILPLDKRIAWIDEPVKFTKRAILTNFSTYHDNRASWYFSPTTDKVRTFQANNGKLYPASRLEDRISVDKMFAHIEEREREIKTERNIFKKHNPEGWRNFPSVKDCLDRSLPPHDRHDPLFKACSAMALNGYKESIPQFLSEVDAPSNHKREMIRQFK